MPKKIADTKKMTHEEWLELRKSSIGGSDAATIMCENPYASLLSLYADKKGLSKAKETNEAMRLGTDLESYVADRYEEETGKRVRNDFFMYQHDDYEFITANIDRRIVGENAGLECKTMSPMHKYDLKNGEIPSQYYAQVQHYMAVMGFEYMDLAILVYQDNIYIFHIDRNPEYIDTLINAEVRFWENAIKRGIEPEPDGSDASMDAIKEMYPTSTPNTEIAIPGIDELISQYRFLKGQQKEIDKELEEIQNKVTFLMKDNEVAVGYAYGCSWKSQSSTRVDTKMLKAEMPDVWRRYAKTTDTRVFRTRNLAKGEK